MALRVYGSRSESAAEILAKRNALRESDAAMVLAKRLSQRFGGSPPRMADTTNSVYFTIPDKSRTIQVRVSDHMANTNRQGGGSEFLNINIPVANGYDDGVNIIKKALGEPIAFGYTIGQKVVHKTKGVASVLGVDPIKRSVQLNFGEGPKWYLVDFALK